jgi:hypothetical protein
VTETPLKLKLLRDQPHVGDNGHGKYFLYSVQDEAGIEFAWFAPQDIHDVIQTNSLKAGSEILVKRVQANGKKGVTKIELSILGTVSKEEQSAPLGDDLKGIMQLCLQEAVEITKSVAGIPFQNEDVRAICSCLFIARTRA